MTSRRVYSRWQSVLLALSFVLAACVGLVGLAVMAEVPAGRWPVIALLVAWCGLCTWLAVRSIRLGVYGDSVRMVTIRGLLRTWSVSARDIDVGGIVESAGGQGSKYYLPVIVIDEPGRERRGVALWWMAAMRERKAREYATHIQALIQATRGDATTGGGRA